MHEIRISLQDKERELLEQIIATQGIKDVAQSIDQLLSFENVYIIVTAIEMATGKEILPGTPNDLYELIDWVRAWLMGSGGWGADYGLTGAGQGPEAFVQQYGGLGGLIRFVWERATIGGWVAGR